MPEPTFDYEAVLGACARGTQAALRDLYHQESPRMLALAARVLADAGAAETIVRDAFVLIWKHAADYDPETGTARAWMYSIMRYRIMNRLRQTGRPIPALKAGWQATLPADFKQNDPSSLIRTLGRLEQTQRLPLLMAYYGGLDYERIAMLMHLPKAQLRAQVHAALAAILEAEPA